MNYEELREAVLTAALEAQRQALIRGTSGNISARSGNEEIIAITPSGIPYEKLMPNDITLVDLQGKVIEGKYKTSSETPMHTAIYRNRPDVQAVVHTHSLYATTFSVLNEILPPVTVPMVAYGMTPVPVAQFELPGTEALGKVVLKVLGKYGNAALLQNHGVICVGDSLEKALEAAVYLEEGAQIALLAKLAGKLNPIPEDYITKMKEILKERKAL